MYDTNHTPLTAFPPILAIGAHTLILGTMPGGKSLEMNQYYAHPQNQFWKLMGAIYGAHHYLPYEHRVEILKSKGIAVWDVLSSCTRIGSLDADIKNAVVNDFESFFNQNPTIQKIVFDSLTAEKFYVRHVLPTLTHNLVYARVPSPSPAHARLPYEAKLALWTNILQPEILQNN